MKLNNNSSILVTVLAALFVLLIIGLFIIHPFIMILALNTLFPLLSIPYSFSTYIAMLFLEAPFIVKLVYLME